MSVNRELSRQIGPLALGADPMTMLGGDGEMRNALVEVAGPPTKDPQGGDRKPMLVALSPNYA